MQNKEGPLFKDKAPGWKTRFAWNTLLGPPLFYSKLSKISAQRNSFGSQATADLSRESETFARDS